MRQAVTDAQGRYQIANLPASSYYVGASAGEFKVWYLGQQYGAPPNSMAYGQIGKKVELAVQLSAWVEPEGRALQGERHHRRPDRVQDRRRARSRAVDAGCAFKLTGRREGEYCIAATTRCSTSTTDSSLHSRKSPSASLLEDDRKSIDLHVVKVPDR
jgi:hypothetical protein